MGVSALTIGLSVINAVTGILIVRSLTKESYAQYSVTAIVISGIASVADAGVISTIMAESGKLGDDRIALGKLVRESYRFRLISYIVSALAFAPVFIYLLVGTKVELISLIMAMVLSAGASLAVTTSAIFQAVLRQKYRIKVVALILFSTGSARLLLVVLGTTALGDNFSFLVVLSLTALVTTTEAWIFRRLMGPLPHYELNPRIYNKELKINAVRQVPNSIFYFIQGLLLPIILVSAGDLNAIADVNALSRYSIGFVVVASVITQIYMTRISRTQEPLAIKKIYIKAVILYIVLGLTVLVILVLFSPVLLSIIGSQYSGLGLELVIISIGGFLGSLVAVLASLNQARAWLRLSWVQIPVASLWIILLLLCIGPIDTYSASWFAALLAIPGILTMVFTSLLGIREDSLQRNISEK